MKNLEEALRKCAQGGVVIGLALFDPRTQCRMEYNAERPFALASVAKLLIAASALRAFEVQHAAAPTSVAALVRQAVSHHDHDATEVLLAMAGGLETVNRQLATLQLQAVIDRDHRAHQTNAASPGAIASLLQAIAAGEYLTEGRRQLLLEALEHQEDSDGLLAGLPAGVSWAHMTGGFAGVCNDVGIMNVGGASVICSVFAEGDPRADWTHLANTLALLGSAIYEWAARSE